MAKLTEEQRRSRAEGRRRTEALRAEADAHRREEQSARWAREGTRLSYEEYRSGVACRGCGEPWHDGTGGWTRGTMHMDAQEQAEYAEAEFEERPEPGAGGLENAATMAAEQPGRANADEPGRQRWIHQGLASQTVGIELTVRQAEAISIARSGQVGHDRSALALGASRHGMRLRIEAAISPRDVRGPS